MRSVTLLMMVLLAGRGSADPNAVVKYNPDNVLPVNCCAYVQRSLMTTARASTRSTSL